MTEKNFFPLILMRLRQRYKDKKSVRYKRKRWLNGKIIKSKKKYPHVFCVDIFTLKIFEFIN